MSVGERIYSVHHYFEVDAEWGITVPSKIEEYLQCGLTLDAIEETEYGGEYMVGLRGPLSAFRALYEIESSSCVGGPSFAEFEEWMGDIDCEEEE